MTTTATPQGLLQHILFANPRASLDEIRRSHPIFQTMSLDQLGVRLSRLLDSAEDKRAK